MFPFTRKMGRRRGLFGTLIKIAADAERASRRRQRELLASARAQARFQEAAARDARRAAANAAREAERAQAEYEAEVFENRIELLLSVHREATPAVDWGGVVRSPRPRLAAPDTKASEAARAQLAAYLPGFFERLFGLTGRRRALEAALHAALAVEQMRREQIEREYPKTVARWEQYVALARTVLAGERAAYDRVVDESGCLEELEELGWTADVEWLSPEVARANLRGQGIDVVPSEEKSTTTRGKLSTKKMPVGRRWEVYQDFLCGAALRAARELLAVLPLTGILVDVRAPLLDSTTGHFEEEVVLSVYCPREGLERVNFALADASDVVSGFMHAMKFSRGKGIAPVAPLDLTGFASVGRSE